VMQPDQSKSRREQVLEATLADFAGLATTSGCSCVTCLAIRRWVASLTRQQAARQ
jgi:hypothetical protein